VNLQLVCIQTVQRVLFVTGIRKMLLQLSETSRRRAVRRSKTMRRYGKKSIFLELMTSANVRTHADIRFLNDIYWADFTFLFIHLENFRFIYDYVKLRNPD